MYTQSPDGPQWEAIYAIIYQLDQELRVDHNSSTFNLSPELQTIIRFFANYIAGIKKELINCKKTDVSV